MIEMLDKKSEKVIKTFENYYQAAKFLNLNPIGTSNNISRAVRGLRKSAYGYKWRIKDERDNM